MKTAEKHEHHFTRSKPNATVEICSCGKFRHTEHAGEPIIEQAVPKAWDVTAQAFSRATGLAIAPERTERIDTTTNELFAHCGDFISVRRAYESFWNDLNPRSNEVVYVREIKGVQS